jgi:hypothetical protein
MVAILLGLKAEKDLVAPRLPIVAPGKHSVRRRSSKVPQYSAGKVPRYSMVSQLNGFSSQTIRVGHQKVGISLLSPVEKD